MSNSPGEDIRLHTDGSDMLRDEQCKDDHKVNRHAVGLIPQTYLVHQGLCTDVANNFRTLIDTYTRHADLPDSGLNEARTNVANCGNNRTAIFNPEVQKCNVMKINGVQDRGEHVEEMFRVLESRQPWMKIGSKSSECETHPLGLRNGCQIWWMASTAMQMCWMCNKNVECCSQHRKWNLPDTP